MIFPEFIPIEFRGMSALTALVLFFMSIGWGSYFWWDRREHTLMNNRVGEVDNKASLLFTKVDETNGDVGEMRSHMAGIHEAVEWIKKDIERKNNT